MNKEDNKFFEYLGEIWRDITAIEFLMRCGIAKKDGDIAKLPKPKYTKGKIYKNYPRSFSSPSFTEVTNEFNKQFPQLSIPEELIQLRNAMAHGLIAEVNNSGIAELVKFKKIKSKQELEIEFSMPLEIQRLAQIRQSLKELRGYIMKEVDDNKV